jgi:hypothetical protein
MERPLLNDKDVYPDDEVLARHLGRAKAAWDGFTAAVSERYPDAALEWRYYTDAKAWLCKFTRKKKTLCWISIWDKHFRTGFYFLPRHDEGVEALPIDPALKTAYREHAGFGTMKPLTIEVRSKKALADVFTVAEFKSRAK